MGLFGRAPVVVAVAAVLLHGVLRNGILDAALNVFSSPMVGASRV
jgi:hypothetical protein